MLSHTHTHEIWQRVGRSKVKLWLFPNAHGIDDQGTTEAWICRLWKKVTSGVEPCWWVYDNQKRITTSSDLSMCHAIRSK
jgi:hypothetical protein